MGWNTRHPFIRFLLTGGVNTLFGFAVYGIAVSAGSPVWGALLLSNAAGIAFNFFTTSHYVFRSLLLTRFPRFAIAYTLIYFINLKLIEWLSIWVSSSISAQAALVVPMAGFSYILMKNFVFSPAGGSIPSALQRPNKSSRHRAPKE